jgi:hypothetical protein
MAVDELFDERERAWPATRRRSNASASTASSGGDAGRHRSATGLRLSAFRLDRMAGRAIARPAVSV